MPPALLVVLALVCVGVGVGGTAWLFLVVPAPSRQLRGRVSEAELYRAVPAAPPTDDAAVESATWVRRRATAAVQRVLDRRGAESGIASRLDTGGVALTPSEWVAIRVGVVVFLCAVLSVLTRNALIAALIGIPLGWALTAVWLRVKVRKRRGAFAEQVPDVLQLVASSLRSGFSLGQALDGVVHDGEQPAAGEIARALAEARIGVDIEQALERVADRMGSRDLSWVVMAIRISREVGGNLAEVLLTTVHTMRERGQLRRQVKALSAEGRLSAYVLVAMPIGIGLWLFAVRRDYLRPLYTTGVGIAMLVAAVAGIGLGSWWLSRIVKVEA